MSSGGGGGLMGRGSLRPAGRGGGGRVGVAGPSRPAPRVRCGGRRARTGARGPKKAYLRLRRETRPSPDRGGFGAFVSET